MVGFASDLGECLAGHGYLRVTTLPLAILPLPFATYRAWFDSLPKKQRIYFRNKFKSAANLRIEYRRSIKGLERQIIDLYQGTLNKSKVDYGGFDQLDPRYFSNVVDGLGEGMQMMLCWKGE